MGSSDDHDRLVRLEERLVALNRLNDERDQLLVERFELEGRTLTAKVDALSHQYEIGHEALTGRVNDLAQVLASSTGTSAGTMRIFLVGAVGLSFLAVVGGILDLALR